MSYVHPGEARTPAGISCPAMESPGPKPELPDLASDLVADLLRAAWLVESARARTYQGWGADQPRYAASEARCRRRADLLRQTLAEHGRRPDEKLLAGHAAWMTSVVGASAGEVPLAELLAARLGDWVDAHAAVFCGEAEEEVRALGEEEKSAISFPSALPEPPPFHPLEIPEVRAPGRTVFRFAILGDLHIGSPYAEETARAAIAGINASGAELVVQLGDITNRGGRGEFEDAARVLAELEPPVTTMLGNHDVYSVGEARLAGRDYYSASFGREPDGVLFTHKGFAFAVLDSAEHAASPFAAFDLVSGSFTERAGGAVVRGTLTVPQHEILAEVAAPGAPPAFVFLHHPPQPFTAFPPILFGLREVDSGRLHAVVDSGNVWGVFAGHTHRSARTRTYGTVPAQEVPMPRDFPFAYALIDVSKNGYAYRIVQLADEDLLRRGYALSSQLHRRYAAGPVGERGFVWSADSR